MTFRCKNQKSVEIIAKLKQFSLPRNFIRRVLIYFEIILQVEVWIKDNQFTRLHWSAFQDRIDRLSCFFAFDSTTHFSPHLQNVKKNNGVIVRSVFFFFIVYCCRRYRFDIMPWRKDHSVLYNQCKIYLQLHSWFLDEYVSRINCFNYKKKKQMHDSND